MVAFTHEVEGVEILEGRASTASHRSRGDSLLPPPELSVRGGAGDSVDWWEGQDKARHSIVSPELSVGGTKETRWTRFGDGTRRALRSRRWRDRGFGPRSVVRWKDTPSPLQNYMLGGRKRCGGLESGTKLVGLGLLSTRW